MNKHRRLTSALRPALVSTAAAALLTLGSAAVLPAGDAVAQPAPVGTWSVVPVPNAGTSGDNSLASTSCPTLTFCAAVGSYDSPNKTLADVSRAGTWSVIPTPDVGTAGSFLDGVSCTSATFCMAVGSNYVGTPPDSATLAEVYNGSTWSVSPTPDVPGDVNQLTDVSCTSPTSCVAVGFYDTGSPDQDLTLVETFNGSAWTITASPNPATNADNVLNGVSCPSAGACTAIGVWYNGATGDANTLVETEEAGIWSVATTPDVANNDNFLKGVSCQSASSCTAVGAADSSPTTHEPLVLSEEGGTWSIVTDPTQPSAAAGLSAVSCTTATSCVAAGTYFTSGANLEQTLVMVDQGGTWSVVASPNVGSGDNSLDGVSCAIGQSCVAVGDDGDPGGPLVLAAPGATGYWEVASDGGIFPFGIAKFDGSMGGTPLNQPVVGMASTPDGGGYWEVASDGGIFSFGDASFHGSMGGTPLNRPVVGMASTPDGGGYWEVASDGGIFSFGDANFYGSMGGTPLNQPVVGMAATPDGGGYWEVAADGGVFAFGDANFYGSMGGTPLNQPVVGMASTPDGGGYWEVAADGGIFPFGDASLHGSMGGTPLNQPVVGMAAALDGGGYWEVAADGGIFTFGDAAFHGSMGGFPLNQPIVGIATPW